MFDEPSLRRALDLQQRTFALVTYLSDARHRARFDLTTLHDSEDLQLAALAFLDRHFSELPGRARPPRRDLDDFSRLLATALEGTFDFVPEPGKRLFSPGAHCFCPFCSWLVDAPSLRPKKLSARDKRLATMLEADVVSSLARELGVSLSDGEAARVAARPALREVVALVAWARALLRRLKGVSEGPASLALWRRFAWTTAGAPKKDFTLTARDVLAAEAHLAESVRATDDRSRRA